MAPTKVKIGGSANKKDVRAANRVKAMSNEKRRAVLRDYRDRGPTAPTEVSERTGISISDVSYHTRKLRQLDCIELVGTEPGKRGSTVKSYYVAIEQHLIDGPEWEDFAPEEKAGALADVFQPIADDVDRGIKCGKLGRDNRFHITRHPLKAMDQQGFDELLAAHLRLHEETTRIAAEAAERMTVSGEESICVSTGQTCFEVDGF